MKILVPFSNSLDLGISAVAALVIHAVVFSVANGVPSRAPIPKVRYINRCESVSMLPKQNHVREKVLNTERVEKEKKRILKDTAQRQTSRLPEVASSFRQIKERECIPLQEETIRDIVQPQEKQRVQETVEKEREVSHTQGREELVLSRAAAPAVEEGFVFDYPRMARRRGYEGSVHLRVMVSSEGQVLDASLVESSGYSILDRSAIIQMKSLPFLPAIDKQGTAIKSTVMQVVNFEIQDRN